MLSNLGNFFVTLVFSNIIVVSFLFWSLTYVGYVVRDEYENYDSGLFYECGFRSLQKVNIKFNLNTLVVALFLVLYEVEFLFLVPFSFSNDVSIIYATPTFALFIIFIILTLLLDVFTQSIIWVY